MMAETTDDQPGFDDMPSEMQRECDRWIAETAPTLAEYTAQFRS